MLRIFIHKQEHGLPYVTKNRNPTINIVIKLSDYNESIRRLNHPLTRHGSHHNIIMLFLIRGFTYQCSDRIVRV